MCVIFQFHSPLVSQQLLCWTFSLYDLCFKKYFIIHVYLTNSECTFDFIHLKKVLIYVVFKKLPFLLKTISQILCVMCSFIFTAAYNFMCGYTIIHLFSMNRYWDCFYGIVTTNTEAMNIFVHVSWSVCKSFFRNSVLTDV